MKKTSITLLLLLVTYGFTKAQCKNRKIVDEFENRTTIITDEFVLMNTPLSFIVGKASFKVEINFYKVDTAYGVFLVHRAKYSTSSIKYIYFKFTDGVFIKKTEPQEYKVNTEAFGVGDSEATSFTLTKKELEKFTTTEVEKVRFEFDNFTDYQLVDKDMNKTQKNNFQKYAQCIQSETK
jgi:hypothetical protein